MIVIPFLLQLGLSSALVKSMRETGNSWKDITLCGFFLSLVLSVMWSMPTTTRCEGHDMYGGYDCTTEEKEPTPIPSSLFTLNAVGLTALYMRKKYEER